MAEETKRRSNRNEMIGQQLVEIDKARAEIMRILADGGFARESSVVIAALIAVLKAERELFDENTQYGTSEEEDMADLMV
jgi:hypothetical protein